MGLLLGRGAAGQLPGACRWTGGAGRVADRFPWLRRLRVDGGHSGDAFAGWVKAHWPKPKVRVIQSSDQVRGFAVLPRRRVVGRTFDWLMRHWRLVRDYERTEASADAWMHPVMIRIQLRRSPGRLLKSPTHIEHVGFKCLHGIPQAGAGTFRGRTVG